MKYSVNRKHFLKKWGLLSFAIIFSGLISFKSYAQNTPPKKMPPDSLVNKEMPNPKMAPPELPAPKDEHRLIQKPDTTHPKGLKTSPPPGTQPMLTPEQIKAITGNDKVVGKDSAGHILYQEAGGQKYYLTDDGKKVYIKK